MSYNKGGSRQKLSPQDARPVPFLLSHLCNVLIVLFTFIDILLQLFLLLVRLNLFGHPKTPSCKQDDATPAPAETAPTPETVANYALLGISLAIVLVMLAEIIARTVRHHRCMFFRGHALTGVLNCVEAAIVTFCVGAHVAMFAIPPNSGTGECAMMLVISFRLWRLGILAKDRKHELMPKVRELEENRDKLLKRNELLQLECQELTKTDNRLKQKYEILQSECHELKRRLLGARKQKSVDEVQLRTNTRPLRVLTSVPHSLQSPSKRPGQAESVADYADIVSTVLVRSAVRQASCPSVDSKTVDNSDIQLVDRETDAVAPRGTTSARDSGFADSANLSDETLRHPFWDEKSRTLPIIGVSGIKNQRKSRVSFLPVPPDLPDDLAHEWHEIQRVSQVSLGSKPFSITTDL